MPSLSPSPSISQATCQDSTLSLPRRPSTLQTLSSPPSPKPSCSPTLSLPPSALVSNDLPLLLHAFPTFRLQLTLFYLDPARTVHSNTTLLKTPFYTPDHANAAALDLARSCRSAGELIMLTHQMQLGYDCLLNDEYIVGRWERSGAVPLDHLWLIHEVQGYRARRARGVVSGRVQILVKEEGG